MAGKKAQEQMWHIYDPVCEEWFRKGPFVTAEQVVGSLCADEEGHVYDGEEFVILSDAELEQFTYRYTARLERKPVKRSK